VEHVQVFLDGQGLVTVKVPLVVEVVLNLAL
jgi:hypothetical protein